MVTKKHLPPINWFLLLSRVLLQQSKPQYGLDIYTVSYCIELAALSIPSTSTKL
jgi:hypothetical protein